MTDVYVISAVRTAVGRRGGALSSSHAADILGAVQRAALECADLDAAVVEQVVGGCATNLGMQAANVTRTAWLSAGLPLEVGGSTVNSACGSSQQATNLAVALIASQEVDVALACGIEVMSTVPIGSAQYATPQFGAPIPAAYSHHYVPTSQFEGAELIADEWRLTREDLDRFGAQSQQRAATAWATGRFARQIVPLPLPADNGGTTTFDRDEGLRPTSEERLAQLTPVLDRPGARHTAATSSQVSDGASALVLASGAAVARHNLRPIAHIVSTCLVGCDPVTMLTGPIPATRRLLKRTGLRIDDIDVFEVNEAFASVVLAWQKEVGADPDRVNPNGGAIALGHPLGATGCILLTKAVHELHRAKSRRALVSMCCGGGLGTGTILEAIP
jgi:acetyl-CoA C-acetyltransferase